MKFSHRVNINGVYYEAGVDIPALKPKKEKVEEKPIEEKPVKKPVAKKRTKK